MKLDKLAVNLLRAVVPLESNPPLSLYALFEKGKTLLLDTGIYEGDKSECTQALDELVSASGNSWDQTSVFVTHFHLDHTGNIKHCAEKGAKIVVPVNPHTSNDSYPSIKRNRVLGIHSNYFEYQKNAVAEWDYEHAPEKCVQTAAIDPLETFSVSNYHLEPFKLPGHKIEQMGLLDRKNKCLFAADQILEDIVPSIASASINQHQMQAYLNSLSDVENLGLQVIYPAHGDPILAKDDEIVHVIDKIKKHYIKYAKALFRWLNKHPGFWSSFDVLIEHQRRTVDFFFKSSNGPGWTLVLKYFSVLEYLFDINKVERIVEDDVAYYSASEK